MAEASDYRLRLLIERIESLEEEKKGIGDDIRDVYAEAKSTGYDPKIMRQIVKLRKMKPDDRREYEAVLDTYKAALGMEGLEGTPMGDVLARLDAMPEAISMQVNGGPVVPINAAARKKAKASA
ncbi:MAG: DUF2312 domain-containing protein [Caulobacteraceae bacterium]|nr:DUF2312 domain-containing protein [Caulobacteraceae bacterium]